MNNRQKTIINCLRTYPFVSKHDRRAITDAVLASITEAGIKGHIGFDFRSKYETAITFESENEISKRKTDKLIEILSQKFKRDDIRVGVSRESNYVEQSDPENPGHLCGHYEDVWNLYINIPHDNPEILSLHEVMTEFEYTHNSHNLPLPVGSHIFGEPLVVDLADAPNVLVSGASGMGKTTLLHNIIISLLYTHTAHEMKLLLIGSKEFSLYEPLQHSYLWHPVASNSTQAIVSLEALNAELGRRYDLLQQSEASNINEYNTTSSETMPYIVTIIDEYSNLVKELREDFNTLIARITQLGRAVGILVIMSTNQITERVITPKIKASFPSRIALKVNATEESQLILDESGAEDLEHKGQVLFPYFGITYDLQNPLVTPDEIRSIVNTLSKNLTNSSI